MSHIIQFPERPITEDELRAAYASMQLALMAQTQARLAVSRLCERARRGAAVATCEDLQLVPELNTIWRKSSAAAKSTT